jgi:imidazolonepropionase-like amidohydrolase
VEIGKRADLVLLAANPLEDIANIRARVGVMLRGVWYSKEALDRMVRTNASLIH